MYIPTKVYHSYYICSNIFCWVNVDKNTKLILDINILKIKKIVNLLLSKHKNIDLILPRLALCGDNAAMIGMCAYYKIMSNTYNNDLEISAIPQYPLEDFSL